MLRNAIVVFAIVLVLGSSGLRPAHLPAAAVMVAVAGMMAFAAIIWLASLSRTSGFSHNSVTPHPKQIILISRPGAETD
jgi:hypothetical protein